MHNLHSAPTGQHTLLGIQNENSVSKPLLKAKL